MNIRSAIVEARRRRIAGNGHAQGIPLPAERRVPIVPFAAFPAVICEVKRRSPSRGAIDQDLDAVRQAGLYQEQGIRSVSVLTEERYFGGSLRDLIEIKKAFPGLSVLRKDFLLDEEDVQVSWAAGADAVLLIASVLPRHTLSRLYRKAKKLGMEVLMELHDEADAAKVRDFAPNCIGINSRNLEDFSIDKGRPVMIKSFVDWKADCIFESGISGYEDALYARSAGFKGILVGEAAVKNRGLPAELTAAFGPSGKHADERRFWRELFARAAEKRRTPPGMVSPPDGIIPPLVKVCGITSIEDARLAERYGAELVGFIFADSPRRADYNLLKKLKEFSCLKVGVVAVQAGEASADPEVTHLLEDGYLDAVQFHGTELPEDCAGMAFPYYKAVGIGGPRDVRAAEKYRAPRTLFDSAVSGRHGGTGTRIPEEHLRETFTRQGLWLAGGLNPDTIAAAVLAHRPELVDVSSGLEARAGKKDPTLVKRFFRELESVREARPGSRPKNGRYRDGGQ